MDEQAVSAWNEFFSEIAESKSRSYDPYDLAGLVLSIGDCLTLDEIRDIVKFLYESKGESGFREALRKAGFGANVDSRVDEADEGTLLQICWLATDESLLAAVDTLIRRGQIKFEAGEIRRPPINYWTVGRFDLRAEFGQFGFRTSTTSKNMPLLRLNRLIERLYDLSNPTDQQEVDWQLRSVEGPTVQARLADFIRRRNPSDTIRSLVLARRKNVSQAFDELKIRPDNMLADLLAPQSDGADKDELIVQAILWKLGFELPIITKSSDQFWRHLRLMSQLVRDAANTSSVDLERIRQVGSSVFNSLEGLLEDCLEYAWWALATDHFSSEKPFVFVPAEAREAWVTLDNYQKQESGSERLAILSKRTLYPLCQSFALFSRYLKNLQNVEASAIRATDAYPRFADRTDIQRFPFKHVFPFLDLLPDAQASIIKGAESVAKIFRGGDVHSIRNKLSHFQRTPVEISDLETALAAARSAVERLETLGFCRSTFEFKQELRDQWGRSALYLGGPDGEEVVFPMPSHYSWVGLPSFHRPQYLFKSAVFGPQGEMLRFTQGSESKYAQGWLNFPRRRIENNRALAPGITSVSDIGLVPHDAINAAIGD
jgi:hypothetical protein